MRSLVFPTLLVFAPSLAAPRAQRYPVIFALDGEFEAGGGRFRRARTCCERSDSSGTISAIAISDDVATASGLLNSDALRNTLVPFARPLAQARYVDAYRIVTYSPVSSTDPERPLTATGRLGLVSAYFHLHRIAATLATGLIASAIVCQASVWRHLE